MVAERTLADRAMQDTSMDQETFNLSIRSFLKMVGINSQREIERAVEKALSEGKLAGSESLPVKMTLQLPGVELKVDFDGSIDLEP
jgi:hypothetical protein